MKYIPKSVVTVEAEQITEDTSMDGVLGIVRVAAAPTKFYTEGLRSRQYGIVGDFVVRWPDDRVDIYSPKAFAAMFEPAHRWMPPSTPTKPL